MSKMWDIAQYVEANPQDHEQRWRLCKKLYAAKEYRLALEHLQVLKNGWEDRKRVRRYLAATYYRLEQYKEGISELKEAVNIWPEEIALREQLAQLYYKSGDLDACADAWEKITEINPKHKHAAQAAKATRAQARGEEYDQFDTDALGDEMDQGFGMSVEVTCPQCNAKNSDEFDRCWNCHAPLGKGGEKATASAAAPQSETPKSYYKSMVVDDEPTGERGRTIWILLGCAGFMALIWLFISVPLLLQATPTSPAMTLDELLASHISGTRVWMGAILLVVWTFLLAISVDIFFKHKPSRVPEGLCAGFCMGALSFALSGQSPGQWPLAFIVPTLVALPIMFTFLPRKPTKIISAWFVHAALVFAFMFVCTMIVERGNTGIWFNPIREYNDLMAYAAKRAAEPSQNGFTLVDSKTPTEKQFRMEATGSAWLDYRAKAVIFHLERQSGDVPLRFEVETDGKTLIFEKISGATWSHLTEKLITGVTYTIKISSEDNKTSTPVKVTISSLLFPRF